MSNIYAEYGSRRVMLALWEDHRGGGRFDELHKIIKQIKTELQTHWQSLDMTEANRDLSEIGKRAKRIESAQDKVRQLGKLANHLTQIRRAAEAEAAALAKLPPLDNAARAAVLIALAERMRAMPSAELASQLLSGLDADLVEAALLLPAGLTGVTPGFRSKVLEAHLDRVHPEQAAVARDLAQAVHSAQNALRRAWKEIAPDSNLDLTDQVAAFNGDTQAAQVIMQGTNARTIERMVERESDPDAHRLMPATE